MLACTQSRLAGSISETTNGGVVGAIVNQGGAGAQQARVVLLPADNDPVKNSGVVSADTTDSLGKYAFSNIPQGQYAILAMSIDKKTSVLAREIYIGDHSDTVAADTLRSPGAVKVMLPAGADSVNGYVYVPGTLSFAWLKNKSGYVTLDYVPVDRAATIAYSTTTISSSTVLRYGVQIKSGDTAVVWNCGWNYSRQITLNTSSSGAGITGSVTNFPVLIRLTAAFDFTQARNSGEDIRFSKRDNTFLPYEIERWDPVARLAEVWVKVDTVLGNDSTQSISMYWGNDHAADNSNSAAVFDSANGFQGDWHLGETGSLVSDATGNRYNGTANFTAPVAGVIGAAQHFNGVSSYIRMKGTASSRLNFPMNGHYTVSAWVYHDTLADSVTYLIAGKGELQYFIKNFDLALSTSQRQRQWEFTEYHGNNIWQGVTFVPATARTWEYLVGIRDGSNQYLYVNGTLAMEGYRVFGTGQDTIQRDTTDDFSIGAFLHSVTDWGQGYAFFNGAIDEVCVSSVPRSADWIKMCYMNQRTDDKLVVFGK